MLFFWSPMIFFKQNLSELDQQTKHVFWGAIPGERKKDLFDIFFRNDPFQVLHPENLKVGKK